MSDTQPKIQTCQPIISQMRRSLKKLPHNGEKRSQNGENLQKDIYANFRKKKLLSPPKVFSSETLYVELLKNLVICFERTLASLLVDTTKTPHSCLLRLYLKQRISPKLLKLQISENHRHHQKPSAGTQNHPQLSTTIHPKTSAIA